MTPADTLVHLRTMRSELQARITASEATAKRRSSLPKDQRETCLTRIQALNSAISMIELGGWTRFSALILR